MKRVIIFLGMVLVGLSSCNSGEKEGKINLRLKWAYQAQFGGYLVAKEKGFYKDAGLDVNIQPAGPDLKPYTTVASGSDDIGIGIIPQLISARSNGVPLVAIAQMFQDSPNRFVLKKKNRIDSLQQLKGKPIGLWLGGDEIEFISMLKSVGMSLNDVKVIPQKFSVAPFLEDEYVLGQVMIYNELNQIKRNGYTGDSLQVISPKDYNSAVLGDLLFTNEKFLKDHPDELKKFLQASFKGWTYTSEHPEEALDIIMKYNKELNRDEQREQLQEVLKLIMTGFTPTKGIGYINKADYDNAKRILLGGMKPETGEYKNVSNVDIQKVFTSAIWDKANEEIKKK